MRLTTTLTAAAAIAVSGVAANAGGLAPVVIEDPVMVDMAPMAAGSLSPAYVVLGLAGALVVAAGALDEDDETTSSE